MVFISSGFIVIIVYKFKLNRTSTAFCWCIIHFYRKLTLITFAYILQTCVWLKNRFINKVIIVIVNRSFINTYSGFDNIAGTETNYQIKREISEGNPKIAVQYMKYEGETEWTKTWSGYYYYPDGGSTTANEAIQAEPNMRLYTADGTIHLQLAEPQWVEVYTICGQCRYRKVVSGSTSIPVTKGIYIIRAGKETVKVQVRWMR